MWKGDMIDGLVPEKPVENGPRRRLSALFQWLTGASSSPDSSPTSRAPPREDHGLPDRIGALRDHAQARRRRDGRRLCGPRRAARAHGCAEDDVVARRTTRRRASGSGARRERPRASTIPTSARSTRSARTAASSSLPWSCSRASRSPSACEQGADERVAGGADRPRNAGGARGLARAAASSIATSSRRTSS